jgi:hypothetical protein
MNVQPCRWGLIGSRALWHARSKVKSSYGKDFRTGMVIRCTLDTDAGTLSFEQVGASGAPHESSSLSWGVAFRDLKGAGVLYPAVALYQRHDELLIRRVPPSQVRRTAVNCCPLATCWRLCACACPRGVCASLRLHNHACGCCAAEGEGGRWRRHWWAAVRPAHALPLCAAGFAVSAVPLLQLFPGDGRLFVRLVRAQSAGVCRVFRMGGRRHRRSSAACRVRVQRRRCGRRSAEQVGFALLLRWVHVHWRRCR